MAITTKKQRRQRRNEALQLIANGVPLTDVAAGFGDEGWVRVLQDCHKERQGLR